MDLVSSLTFVVTNCVVLCPKEFSSLQGLMFSFEKAKVVTVMTPQDGCEVSVTCDFYKKNYDRGRMKLFHWPPRAFFML